ncbi:DUF4436 domain-containing protein [Mycobacterium kubicae]|uniref:DUF4436 domain-containing protein n=1 Tax=Mycobacterium kubicae TaxID=120959 RepID=A0AAX1JEI9_9MYCO|nr:DUF4436 domain-containing protein [Mycobacterium kubicae]MCV7096788.1 DUF4436 domain-containing protein [Mycobacterium kubicae]ORW01543.1 hypothetical protein AWC13_07085 [Mycobacterium kubicae]QNI10786.1 DUF4436 domain-containing protein [Mycobacterium kubicae]QPI38995.1 DUF4436 domain-containing protein [Mycobacterium kubicae]GFG63122.1 DUF4436 domain-containing protein [Mycobacterium kubicae]
MKVGLAGLLLFIVAYFASTSLYGSAGKGPHDLTQGQPTSDGTTVTIDLQDVAQSNTVLLTNLAIAPGPALLDPRTHGLTEELSVVVTSTATPTKRSWSKDMLPGTFPVPLTLSGDVANWPFDHYLSGPVTVELFRGPDQVPERAAVTFVDRLAGWQITIPAPSTSDGLAPYRVQLRRSAGTVAFAVVIVGVLVALAGVGLLVAVQTARDKRKFQPPMTTWYAAMLFAVVPLRNALPNAPPFGSWIDVRVVLWVIVVLVLSMLIYITCWWRHLAPEKTTEKAPEAPAQQ